MSQCLPVCRARVRPWVHKRPAALHQRGYAEIWDVRHPTLECRCPACRIIASAKARQGFHQIGQRDHGRAAQAAGQRHRHHLLEQIYRGNQVALAERQQTEGA